MYSTLLLTTIAASTAVAAATGSVHVKRVPRELSGASFDSLFARAAPSCSNAQLSCHNTTAQSNLCCFNYPGGNFLQTQFWDSNPATGPSNHWTVHGLWPDHCDGTYDQYCDNNRQYTNITQILQSYGQTDLLDYMNTYWKNQGGIDESFWEHEWGKHGTCISTLNPSCYSNYMPQQEVVEYFQKTVQLFKILDSYTFLANAGIVPSTSTTYTATQIAAALKTAYGYNVAFQCNNNNELDEIYYYYNIQGAFTTGTFVSTDPDNSDTSCSSTGIKYLPKVYTTSTTTTSTTATSTTPTPTSTSTTAAVPFTGKGYLNALPSGSTSPKGCLISAGVWYVSGTCATYTATSAGARNTFILKSSKGPCGIDAADGHFVCNSTMSYTNFNQVGGYLTYGDSQTFGAAKVPAGTEQVAVYAGAEAAAEAVQVEFQWFAL